MQPYALCKELMEKNVNPAFEHFKSSNAGEVAGRGRRVELINAKFEPCN